MFLGNFAKCIVLDMCILFLLCYFFFSAQKLVVTCRCSVPLLMSLMTFPAIRVGGSYYDSDSRIKFTGSTIILNNFAAFL